METLTNARRSGKPLPIKALQYGEGNFLRAFVDWMIDLCNRQGLTEIGVAVVPPRFRQNRSTEALKGQDCLYTVLLEGAKNGKPAQEDTLVECIQQVVVPQDDIDEYRRIVCSPELRFVFSNTTEAGIAYAPDDARADIPATFPGKVASMLRRRWQHFNGDPDRGLIFVCCELIEDNGTTLKQLVLRQGREAAFEQECLDWIDRSCTFCDSLVDRIVSGYPRDNAAQIEERLGYRDAMMTKGELYHLWVIGGEGVDKVARELPLDRAGLNVKYLPGIKEFRDKKVRILNGTHTAMVPVGLQLGCEVVLDAMQHADLRRFLELMLEREVLPVINDDPAELKAFAQETFDRFMNPFIKHQLRSIALNSLSKWEARNWPTARDYYAKTGRQAPCETFALAALLILYGSTPDYEPQDNPESISKIRAAMATDGPKAYAIRGLMAEGVFGTDFEAQAPGIAQAVAKHVEAIERHGMARALSLFLSENGKAV